FAHKKRLCQRFDTTSIKDLFSNVKKQIFCKEEFYYLIFRLTMLMDRFTQRLYSLSMKNAIKEK
ncbi:hypothetical protein, partial [Bacteroides fragilis]|uniref:hypothetical protein n=1 Tax=Bacteroides fragilis TaxID=817 RepID=UPI001C7071D3